MKYGVQIFGCLKEFRDNPDEFFKKLSEIGYSQIEPCVLFGDTTNVPPQFLPLLWKPEEVPEFVEMMKKYDLTLTSCHVFAVPWLSARRTLVFRLMSAGYCTAAKTQQNI